jgi:hypothetical protein
MNPTTLEMWTRLDAALEEALRLVAGKGLSTLERQAIARLARDLSRHMPRSFLRYIDAISAAVHHIDDADTVEPLLDVGEVLRPLDEDHACALHRVSDDACELGATRTLFVALLRIAGHTEHHGELPEGWIDLVAAPGALADHELAALAICWARHRGVDHPLSVRLAAHDRRHSVCVPRHAAAKVTS